MKHAAYLLMASLALCWALTGCGKSQPAAQPPAAAAPTAEASGTPAADAAAPSAEVTLPEVDPAALVAKVGDKDITEGDVQKVLGMFLKQMGGKLPPEQMEAALPRLRERIVEELVMRSIMLAEVAKTGVSLSDSEFAEIKNELAQELPEGKTLEDYMSETGTTETEMREQMAVRKMVIAKAESLPKPSDDEIQKYYDENKENFSQGETVAASHILIKTEPTDDDAAKAAKRERLEGLRKQIQEGADFAEVAKTNSDCPSASAGGDLGSFGRGQMVPEFEAAAFSQETGTVGDIVETQFGYHLIKVTEHQQAKELDFAEVKPRISDILYSQKQQEAVQEYVEGLRKQANVQRFDQAPEPESVVELDVEEDLPPEAPAAAEPPAPPAVEPAPAPAPEAAPEATAAPVEAPAAPAVAPPADASSSLPESAEQALDTVESAAPDSGDLPE